MKPRSYQVVSLFCGLGGKTLGFLQARGREGSRFESVGAFDKSVDACRDFELLTGAKAQAVDIGALGPAELAALCRGRPDVVIMSPPCQGFSGCLPEAASKTEKYQDLNDLALHSINIVLEAWPVPPAFILLENVPRMKTRGKDLLVQIKALLWEKGYDTDLRTHDCGVIGGLAQSRERVLLVARHRKLAPTPMLKPEPQALRSMASVLWQLPVPLPGSTEGGRMHRLPRLSALNWLRLAAIRKGNDWRDLPAEIRLPSSGDKTHAGKYGVQDDGQPAHTVISEARTGKGWADVSDPRCGGDPSGRQSGLYGVCASDGPSHTVVAAARAGSHSWASVTDTRLNPRAARQNGGFGVNDDQRPSHSVIAEGTVRNTFASVADPRLEYSARDGGSHGVADPSRSSVTVIGRPGIANGTAAIADPRSGCIRREGSIGVSDPARHYPTTIIANQKVENTPTSVADPRVKAQRRGAYQVLDPARPGQTIRGRHDPRVAPSSVADDRGLFQPTHRLMVDQILSATRDEWTSGTFELEGPPLELGKKGAPVHVIIEAPDGTVHRPMTTLELGVLQSLSPWHRPYDPTEMEIGDEGGQWLELTGKADSGWRERIGNMVPRLTAKAIGNVVLEILDAGATEVFRLSAGGVWVAPELVGATT